MFFLSPVLSLFSLKFYRQLATRSLRLGFGYLVYLTALLSIAITVFVNAKAQPEIRLFTEWFKTKMPEVTLAPAGLSINVQEPYEMVYPKWKLKIVFDTQRDVTSIKDLGDAQILVGKTKIFVKVREGEMRVYDLSAAGKFPQTGKLTPQSVELFYNRLKGLVVPIVLLAAFVIVLVWKLLAALFYSLIALVVNLFRKTRLPYPALLNISFFLLTPVVVLQIVGWWIVPRLYILASFPVSMIVLVLYMVLAILLTQEESGRVEPGPKTGFES